MAEERRFKIHPAIGVARVGNADPDDFFIGPETPGLAAAGEAPGTAVPPYKVRAGNGPARIKPQGARFHLWEYKKVGGKWAPAREVLLADGDVESIEWTAHLANKKASFFRFEGLSGEGDSEPARHRNGGRRALGLDIDPGARRIAARRSGAIPPAVRFDPGTSDDPAREQWPVFSGPVPGRGTKIIDYLGELRLDDKGRLIVLGGKGTSKPDKKPTKKLHYANNNGWWDDVSDGPVSAVVTLQVAEGRATRSVSFTAEGAWALVGPADFAPHTPNVVTLYDLLYDMAARKLPLPDDDASYDGPLVRLKRLNDELLRQRHKELTDYRVSFDEEIYPLLRRALGLRWVFPTRFHNFVSDPGWDQLGDPSRGAKPARHEIFDRIRPPVGLPDTPIATMPRLFGETFDEPGSDHMFLRLTPTQYFLLKRWADGHFDKPGEVPPPVTAATITPEGLDQAAAENCSGGSFFPGIEVGWQIRAPGLYREPFRVDHTAKSTYNSETDGVGPGHFSRQMALPWQADFADCCADELEDVVYGWWPAQRPDAVAPDEKSAKALTKVPWHRASSARWSQPDAPSELEMVEHWSEFGIVLRHETLPPSGAPSAVYFETEREPKVPFS